METLRPDWTIGEAPPGLEECAGCEREGRIGFDLEAWINGRAYCAACTEARDWERLEQLARASTIE